MKRQIWINKFENGNEWSVIPFQIFHTRDKLYKKASARYSTLLTPPKRESKNMGIAMSTIDANSTNSAAHATISSKQLRLLYYNIKIKEVCYKLTRQHIQQ